MPSDLPLEVREAIPRLPREPEEGVARLTMALHALEALAIDAALKATGGNQTRAAALLGINRVTLYRKLRGPTAG